MWKVIRRRGYDIEYWIVTEFDGIEYALEARFDDEHDAKSICDKLNSMSNGKISEAAADRINELENMVYNLNLYLSFIHDKHPQIFDTLMEQFDGMGGYTGNLE